MSLFQKITVGCPSCGKGVEFNAVYSVNADRRPDLRAAIIDGDFQNQACPQCGEEFRLAPEFTYLDVKRGQWIAVFPLEKRTQWPELEAQARAAFGRAYGAKASAAAREIGASLQPRLVFGWAALREKLVAVEAGLDDVTLELVKAALIRGLESSPVDPDAELRFTEVVDGELAIASIEPVAEELVELLSVPRSLYDEILAKPGDWAELRQTLTAGVFVDLQRLILSPAASEG